MKSKIFLMIFLGFFIPGLFTLKNYGISWDEPNHFLRGQAYLWYFLTGEKDYSSLPKYSEESARSDVNYHERSYYQNDDYDYNWQIINDGDHPVLNDILASFTNYIFYQKLGVLGEIDAYHVFGLAISALLISIVFLFGYEAFGLLTGLFSAIFMATYPLFWSESHFNVKDPPETAFFALVLFCLWKAFNHSKTNYIYLTGIFVGIALSIKFNIVFVPLIIFPWVFYLIIFNKKVRKFIFSIKFIYSSVLSAVISLIIFFIHWPFLWQDLVGNTLKVMAYYTDIGLESDISTSISSGKFNFYPLIWILITTQPMVLFFLIIGLLFVIVKRNEQKSVMIMWTLWLLVPIGRVVFPGTSIYGGVRQIMEYMPALCLIAGVGLDQTIKYLEKVIKTRKPNFLTTAFGYNELIIIFSVFVVLLFPIIRLHPNENVYFNFLIGGIDGAIKKDIPFAGFTFGNGYYQGIKWLNENAPSGSKLALIEGTSLNVPRFLPRSDIEYSNNHWSGALKEGEYLMDITYNREKVIYNYAWEYVETFLEPVYEVKAGGVAVAKIWKNDIEHTKPEVLRNEIVAKNVLVELNEKSIEISLDKVHQIVRLEIYFDENSECGTISGEIDTSSDYGKWIRELEPVPYNQITKELNLSHGRMMYYFPARNAKYLRYVSNSTDSCIFNNSKVEVYVLE